MSSDWKTVKGEKGIYVRDYGGEKAYQIQHSVNCKRRIDVVGVMPLEKVRIIRDRLIYNRKMGTGPQTWADMEKEDANLENAKKLEEAQKAKELLEQERKRRINTVSKCWEELFWPHRLTLLRSHRENQSIRGRWLNWIKPFFGSIPLTELTPAHFNEFLTKIRELGRISDTTIFKCFTDLRLMWNYALDTGLIVTAFPGKRTARELSRGIDNEKKCWLTPDEVRLLVKTVWERRLQSRLDHDVYCFVILGVALGLRAGDICKLNQQAVERHIIDKTKNRRSRFVHFNYAPVRAMLDERLKLYPPENPTDPLFVTTERTFHGNARTEPPKKYFKIIKELGFNETPRRKDHPLEKIDFHALRHTFATLAAMAGVDHLTLMRLMGHKTPAMTLRYIEIADAHQAKYQEQAMQGIFPVELEKGKAELDKLTVQTENELE